MSNSNQILVPPMDPIVRVPWTCYYTTLSRTTLWRLEKEGKFPKRRKIGNHAVGWLKSEILAWVADCPTVSEEEL